MKLKIISVAHHRNGVIGAPFDVVLFDERAPGNRKVGILFGQEAHCAVLDVDLLAAGDIAFGSNSWRGDDYEPPLRRAVSKRLGIDEPASPIDVHDLLARRRQVAVIWSIEDVQSVRDDLSDDQAWEVLQECRHRHDCEYGFTWTLIEIIADELFPEPTNRKE